MSDYLKKRMEYILKDRPLAEKKTYSIPKVSEKRKAKMEKQQQLNTESALDGWFEDRRKEMTGHCMFCGGKTEKDNDEKFHFSIHHLFEKRPTMFPSVATHPDNWLELCFYGNSCHTNIHNGTITWELLKDSAEWEVIIEKARKIYPFMAVDEIKNIPDIIFKDL